MASSVFFKFKSQKEPQRVTFDGTGITVFELKRDIISISRLGDGSEFDLKIYNEDTNEEYDDDTSIISRSASVTAKRLPASKPGQGRAARYVSGKIPAVAKNAYRTEQQYHSPSHQSQIARAKNGLAAMEKAQTEEERIAAMFLAGADQWEETKQQMASATPVYRPSGLKNKLTAAPDKPPPSAYVCYRCGEKGHWIQACPTNNDPNFDGKPRVKRTTGIPRSFLQTVEKPVSLSNDEDGDEIRQPSGVMVNAEGDFVVAVPDKAAWEQFQAKAKALKETTEVVSVGNEELRRRGIECPLDQCLFVNPVKTPCCGNTYCHDCIDNALVNSDLVCPGCSTEDVLIDSMEPDKEKADMVKAYLSGTKSLNEVTAQDEPLATAIPQPAAPRVTEASEIRMSSSVRLPQSDMPEPKRKRLTGDETLREEDIRATGKVIKTGFREVAQSSLPSARAASKSSGLSTTETSFVDQMNAMAKASGFVPNQLDPNFLAAMNAQMGQAMSLNMNMSTNMMNSRMIPVWPSMPLWNGGFGMPNMNMNMGISTGASASTSMNMSWDSNMMTSNGSRASEASSQQFNQNNGADGHEASSGLTTRNPSQRHVNDLSNTDQDAYIRKPVNPNRARGRQRNSRPMDYREI